MAASEPLDYALRSCPTTTRSPSSTNSSAVRPCGDFEITKTEIKPTVGNEDYSVEIEMRLEEEGVDHVSHETNVQIFSITASTPQPLPRTDM